MKKLMNPSVIKPAAVWAMVLLFSSASSFTRAGSVHAGSNQMINWEKTHTAKLEGRVSSDKMKVEWQCAQNAEVVFKAASKPVTGVTFPRPGYYLLILAGRQTDGSVVSDSVIVNAAAPGSYQERLSDLIGLMTVDEKIRQLTNESDAIPRLGIPAYNYWSEALHGVLTSGATSFPQAVALGATWDPDLVRRIGAAISDEARAIHVMTGKGLTYWSPTVNIARDPRWGRNEESYSEDPVLLSSMGVAFVKGMQGDDPYYLKTVSTPKHFIANNEEHRRHTGSSDVDMRSLFEYYIPAFHAAVTEGKAYSVMGAYNELNHVPCNANPYLLTDLLRREWGFEGYVVSDCGAIFDMLYGHRFYKSGAEAAARSVLAGCDLNCGTAYRQYLQEALDQGLLEERDIDRALQRVLSARFRLGEFDPPEMNPYTSVPVDKLDCQEHRDLALEAARKSIVLLKNKGILPLQKEKIRSIAVIGPNAARAQLGIYSGSPNIQVSPLEGIRAKAGPLGIEVEYVKGCDLGGGLLRPIESKYFTEIEGTGKTGMRGEYFDNMTLSGEPLVTRIDSEVDFSFGTYPPAPGVPEEHFSVRWTGKLVPPETIRRIGVSNDDGARLYIDGRLIIDDWHDHAEKENRADVELEAGKAYEIVLEFYDNALNAEAKLVWDLRQAGFGQAREAAARNDAAVLVLGLSPGLSQEELDRQEIELPAVQRNLIRAVSEVNQNVVVVLVNGGPVALSGTEDKVNAIVEAWYAGEFGGTAIADVLFGNVNPGGKLPQTFYTSTEQLPPFSDYDLIHHPRTYMYFDRPVLFPFGHGLSYTQFKYSDLKPDAGRIGKDGEAGIQLTVKNTGKVRGDEVVQVYARALDASKQVPVRQLKRFRRITLEPGESRCITFTIPSSEFSFYDVELNDYKIESGAWEIQAGSSSEDIRLSERIIIE
ncbi:glycoside hydrolase family 3 C-terminal domain-containing protein [bacterium]|nr:glycoside hydrolase family 3 C-terminal domain-containing protein [bacterium]